MAILGDQEACLLWGSYSIGPNRPSCKTVRKYLHPPIGLQDTDQLSALNSIKSCYFACTHMYVCEACLCCADSAQHGNAARSSRAAGEGGCPHIYPQHEPGALAHFATGAAGVGSRREASRAADHAAVGATRPAIKRKLIESEGGLCRDWDFGSRDCLL